MDSRLSQLQSLFLAMGDKTRLRLLALMAEGEVSVGFLADQLGESQPKVSRHLAYLRGSGIVTTRRDGKWIYYDLHYPDHVSQHIIDTVITALNAEVPDAKPRPRIAKRNIYGQTNVKLSSSPASAENIYAETDTSDHQYENYAFPSEDPPAADDQEMDVFLL